MIAIGDSVDPFYRYKRPVSIVENKTGKTIITNIDAIAKSLHTKTSYILYFIQLEKSTSITNKNEIKTILSNMEIENFINQFIDKYILCDICKYPELVTQKSGKKLYFSCNACGRILNIPLNRFTKIMYRDFIK
jgi:translation initiation factor 2 beta subunit (eIF-2beta)/eIF-5